MYPCTIETVNEQRKRKQKLFTYTIVIVSNNGFFISVIMILYFGIYDYSKSSIRVHFCFLFHKCIILLFANFA